jgi:uncharacterized repeat protein (TIGR03803 family)
MKNALRIVTTALVIVLGNSGTLRSASSITVTSILGFTNNNGAYPFGGVVAASNGTLYGATFSGGKYGYGVVYQLTPPVSGGNWTPSIVLSFANPVTQGSNPYGNLLVASNGTLYGTTTRGGAYGAGTVFSLTPPAAPSTAWTESLLYSFGSPDDGAFPYGGLVMDSNGVLYGTTVSGGAGLGTVFSLAQSSGTWVETILHIFSGTDDAANPYAGLALSSSGTLYGTSPYGGIWGFGTVFALTQSAGVWTESVLYSFVGGNTGSNPYGGLLVGSSGQLFGATTNGGTTGAGTVFQLSQISGVWTENVIFNLPSYAASYATLIADDTGALYGTTPGSHGASANDGIIFRLVPPKTSGGAWSEQTLYGFPGALGNGPRAGLVWGIDNQLYGATVGLGPDSIGTVFQLTF